MKALGCHWVLLDVVVWFLASFCGVDPPSATSVSYFGPSGVLAAFSTWLSSRVRDRQVLETSVSGAFLAASSLFPPYGGQWCVFSSVAENEWSRQGPKVASELKVLESEQWWLLAPLL